VDVKSRPAKGTIVEVRKGAGSTTLPFDHVVLSGQGSAAARLTQHAKVGQDVQIELGVKDYGVNELTQVAHLKASNPLFDSVRAVFCEKF